jgi:hypothetical protein
MDEAYRRKVAQLDFQGFFCFFPGGEAVSEDCPVINRPFALRVEPSMIFIEEADHPFVGIFSPDVELVVLRFV